MSDDMSQANREMYYYPTNQGLVDGVLWYTLNINQPNIMKWVETQDPSMWSGYLGNENNKWRRMYDVHCEIYMAMKLKFEQ